MFARFGWTKSDPANLEKALATYQATIAPQLPQVEGFCGTFACADRSNGRLLVVTLWRDEEAMIAHERANAQRFIAQAVEASGVPEPNVERYEVVLWEVGGAP